MGFLNEFKLALVANKKHNPKPEHNKPRFEHIRNYFLFELCILIKTKIV